MNIEQFPLALNDNYEIMLKFVDICQAYASFVVNADSYFVKDSSGSSVK
jgi:hypothetical protein